MTRRAAVLLIALARGSGAQTVALTHVNVIDLERGRVVTDQTVLIADGRIAAVGEASTTKVPRGATRVDYRGKYLIPGLWDMHAHLGKLGQTSFALYLANGVTGVRDMGSSRALIQRWRDSIASAKLLAPRLIVAGPIVEREAWLNAVRGMAQRTGDSALMNDLAQRIPIGTPESARQVVDSVIALRGDFLKIRNDPAPAATFAMLRHARERGLTVVGHWPERISPAEASDSGYKSLEHGPLTSRNGTLVPTLDQMSAEERRALFAKFVKNGTAFTPTMIALKGYRLMPESSVTALLADTLGRIDPRMRYVTARVLRAWKAEFDLKKQETGPPLDWAGFSKSWDRDVHDMADAGVLILAGSDAGAPLVFTGFAVLDELELMVNEAGLTALQSLRSATITPARWLRAEEDFGSIAPGRRADLVVLDANPLERISNVRQIAAVVRDGRVLDRAALERLLESAKR